MMNWILALSETAAIPATTNTLSQLPLFTKGLVVTLVGLLSVFLVLTLYFVTIKLISRAKDKGAE